MSQHMIYWLDLLISASSVEQLSNLVCMIIYDCYTPYSITKNNNNNNNNNNNIEHIAFKLCNILQHIHIF